MEFLKSIGCRTIHIPNNIQSDISQDNCQTLENFIQDLLKQRKNLSNNDINAFQVYFYFYFYIKLNKQNVNINLVNFIFHQ